MCCGKNSSSATCGHGAGIVCMKEEIKRIKGKEMREREKEINGKQIDPKNKKNCIYSV